MKENRKEGKKAGLPGEQPPELIESFPRRYRTGDLLRNCVAIGWYKRTSGHGAIWPAHNELYAGVLT